jgi:ABC-type sugar transport system ATPase subunit
VIVGVRSSDLTVTDPGSCHCGSWSWTGSVSTVEFQGSRTLLSIDLDGRPAPLLGDTPVARATGQLQVLASGSTRLSIGDRCGVTATADALHVFDARTGERLAAHAR